MSSATDCELTCSLRTRDEGLARVAHLEDGGRLDVVPLLEGEGVHPVEALQCSQEQHPSSIVQQLILVKQLFARGQPGLCCGQPTTNTTTSLGPRKVPCTFEIHYKYRLPSCSRPTMDPLLDYSRYNRLLMSVESGSIILASKVVTSRAPGIAKTYQVLTIQVPGTRKLNTAVADYQRYTDL